MIEPAKNTRMPVIVIQGVDNYADVGNPEAGDGITLNVLGIEPVQVPMGETQTKVGGTTRAPRQKWTEFNVIFHPFKVKKSAILNDFSDYLKLQNILNHKYIVIGIDKPR